MVAIKKQRRIRNCRQRVFNHCEIGGDDDEPSSRRSNFVRPQLTRNRLGGVERRKRGRRAEFLPIRRRRGTPKFFCSCRFSFPPPIAWVLLL
ncbi:hypothetical protein LINPERPRIM_LOCUS22119 [Linum perenne]